MVIHETYLSILAKIDIYLVIGLMSRGEVLPYPLPGGDVGIRVWAHEHYGVHLISYGCMRIAVVEDLVE